jgi:hypothetical protein
MVNRVQQKGYDGIKKVQASEREGQYSTHEPAKNSSPSVFSLDVDYPSQDVIRSQDSRIDMIRGVIPSGFDSSRINRDNAVDDFGLAPGPNKNDHISRPNGPALVGNDVQTIPTHEERVHAGADITNIFLFHWFHCCLGNKIFFIVQISGI